MPRQHTHRGGMAYILPDDLPQRLKRFQKESGLLWEELARRLGTSSYTVWRWHEGGVRPIFRHSMALLELAESLGLGHLFINWTMPEDTRG